MSNINPPVNNPAPYKRAQTSGLPVARSTLIIIGMSIIFRKITLEVYHAIGCLSVVIETPYQKTFWKSMGGRNSSIPSGRKAGSVEAIDMEYETQSPNPVAPERTFLQTFVGSFVSIKDYPLFAERSLASALGHFAILVTLVCSLYAVMAAQWLNVHVDPYLWSTAKSVPEIQVHDGVASSPVQQPYFFKIEGETIAVIDTKNDPEIYLEGNDPILVLSEHHVSSRNAQGKIEAYKLEGDFEINAAKVQGWIQAVESWTLPVLFLFAAVWQFAWKAMQVLLVAAVLTLVHKSRPSFSTHLRLATYALGPAMAWGLIAFGAKIVGVFIPFAGLIFWAILFSLTAGAAARIKNSPRHH